MVYDLPERYFFYPAQFWPHKNHLRIVQALSSLRKNRDSSPPIVFSGSQTGEIRQETFREVMALASGIGVHKQVQYVGYLPDEDIAAVYAESAGLVMPTFFGPTNIPILEAWAYGCPVLTSDIRGIREQVADAAIVVDPTSIEALADGMYWLWTDKELCARLALRGMERLAHYTPADFRSTLIKILEEAKARIRQGVSRQVSI
jgi:glycosyltransferase involved in cell wall biosynthesis